MKRPTAQTAVPIFIAFAVAAIAYFHNDLFIDFSDEGFLWYGARHILRGQVPILDFQAYDPARYYWCAAVFSIFGDGLMPLRLAAGLFQFAGLSFGLLALRRAAASAPVLFLAGLLSVFFMLLPCRYFTAVLAPIALFFAVRLVEEPSFRRHLEAGIGTGLITCVAINHGFYAFAAFLALMLYLDAKGRTPSAVKKCSYFLSGILMGLVPLWALCLTVPGFWQGYLERFAGIMDAFMRGKANVAFPVPWPWSVSWQAIRASSPNLLTQILEYSNRVSIGVLFIFVVVYYLFALSALVRLKKIREGPEALFIASVFIGFFYLGHVFARADLVYLGEGIFPVGAGLLALWASARTPVIKRLFLGALLFFAAAGFLSAGLRSNIVFKTMVPKSRMVSYPVGKDRIWLLPPDAEYCDRMKELVSKYVRPEDPMLLTPLLTTFYCILDKESPVYELYFHIAPPEAMERFELGQLEQKKVRWAIVGNLLIDGRPEQSLFYSHPLLWKYLMGRFEVVTNQGLKPGYFLMRRKS